MRILKNLFFTCLCLVFFSVNVQLVYGHGWGIDTTTIEFDDRDISISVEIPSDFDETKDKVITITAIDKESKKNVENVTFLIGLKYDRELVFNNYFFTPDGNLNLYVIPKSDGETQIIGEQDSLLGAWYETPSQPIQLVGPIFESGGLYNFEIELRTIDDPTNIVENLGTYNVDVSMVQSKSYQKNDINNNQVEFKTKSYFDKISNFDYDPDNNLVSLEMPFDWSEKTVSHIPVVHVEVHFPKNFIDLLKPSYTGKINGVDLFKSNVIIDDYTIEDERIVHYVILQDHLQYLKNELKKNEDTLPEKMFFTLEVSDTVSFPMNAMTRDEMFSVDLSWDPVDIEPNKQTKFVFTIRDGSTGEPLRQSTYDFSILQNNVEIYKKSGKAQVGGDFEVFTFSESQTGPTVIRFDNIRGTGSGTEFSLVVIPEFGFLSVLVLAVSIFTMLAFTKKYFNYSI